MRIEDMIIITLRQKSPMFKILLRKALGEKSFNTIKSFITLVILKVTSAIFLTLLSERGFEIVICRFETKAAKLNIFKFPKLKKLIFFLPEITSFKFPIILKIVSESC